LRGTPVADFQTFLRELLLPEALRRGMHTLVLILDNGRTHAPKRLEAWLAEYVQTQGFPLTVQVGWLPVRASWLDQIEIGHSILQRQVLQPNHFTSLHELEQTLLDFIPYYNEKAKPMRWSYTVAKLTHKLGTD